jgi:dissimilatory sulfite reductase related protein
MPVFEYGSIKIEVDEDGFITESDKWNSDVAVALATTEGISEMTEAHWKIANYLRDYYVKFGIAPQVRKLCKETGFSLKEIYELYPSGPAKGACKVAGLTKPTGCV